MFKNAQLEGRVINIDGEKLSNLRFADDVALTTEHVKDMEHRLYVNERKLKDWSQDTQMENKIYDKYWHNRQHANKLDRNREGD